MFFDPKKRAQRDIAKLRKKWDREEKRAMAARNRGNMPMQYQHISVPDWDRRTMQLSSFRKAYADFFGQEYYQENSALQILSTQMFWHRMYLQRLRLDRLGITIDMTSDRVQRSEKPQDSVIEDVSFDGRYVVSEINEAIYSKRTFMKQGQPIGTFNDHDSVNYCIMSAKQHGPEEIICPNCGNPSTRENLIDGCDYCNTKFTIDDLVERVGGFDFQIEVAKEGLAEDARQAQMTFEAESGSMVRAFDPNFSIKSFKTSLYNKLAAIHFAESFQQISAFSNIDLSSLLIGYQNIVNIDFDSLNFWDNSVLVRNGLREHNDYYVEDGTQHLHCSVRMVIFELVNGTVQLRNELVKLDLEKSADCKTQNICGPSVLKCKGCGTSLSLMSGKICTYCGRELDMKMHDWVITSYESKLSECGVSSRTFN